MSVLCFRCSTVWFLAAFLAALSTPPVAAQPAGAVSELTDLRTATAKLWLNANGTTTAEIFSGPVYYQDSDGTWKEIDTSLVSSDSGYSVLKNSFRTQLAAQAAGWHLMELNGVPFTFRADAANSSSGTVDGNTITYPDAWPSVDLRYSVLPTGIKEELVLRAAPLTQEFRFIIRPGGLRPAETGDGGIDFTDGGGRPVIQALAPFMYDSKGWHSWSIKSTITANRDGSLVVCVRPDPAWLSKASYPVVLDPTDTIYSMSVDQYAVQGLESGGPNTWEPAGWTNGTTTLAIARQEGSEELPGVGAYAFVKFDTSSISTSAVVITADIQLTAATTDPNRAVSIRRVTGYWPGYSLPPLGPVLTSCSSWSSGAHTFSGSSVTNMVADWIHTPSSNYGAEFQGPTSGSYTMSCYASEYGQTNSPKLTVGYVVDSTPPDPPVVTDDGQYTTVNTQLHASWTCSDEQSGIKEYKYAVGTTPGATNIKYWTSTGIATWPNNSTGTSASPTFSPPLADGTYYFTVRAWNWAGLPSAQGNSDGITVDTVAPTFSNLLATPAWATLDTFVVITFTASETLAEEPTVTVNDHPAVFLYKLDGQNYTYMYRIATADSAGWATIAISGTDLAGNPGSAPANTTALRVYSLEAGAPTVADDGEETVDAELHATWEVDETEFTVEEYWYAVGTTAGASDVQDWTSAGTDTEVTTPTLTLTLDGTYFVSVKARDSNDTWTPVGTSDGIKYVDFMLEVDFPQDCDLLQESTTLPQTWEDDEVSDDVRGRVAVRTGDLTAITVTVNNESVEVTQVDSRHATWTNLNSSSPVAIEDVDWCPLTVTASIGSLGKTRRVPLGRVRVGITVLGNPPPNDYVRYYESAAFSPHGYFHSVQPEPWPYPDIPAYYARIKYTGLKVPDGILASQIAVGFVQNVTSQEGKMYYAHNHPHPPQYILKYLVPCYLKNGVWDPDPPTGTPVIDCGPDQYVFYGPYAWTSGDPGTEGVELYMDDSPAPVPDAPWTCSWQGGGSQFGTQVHRH